MISSLNRGVHMRRKEEPEALERQELGNFEDEHLPDFPLRKEGGRRRRGAHPLWSVMVHIDPMEAVSQIIN